ncbi:hypothetical protein A3I25_02735 [Candidatus Nomurabacteria bacterium RIFCSPLOWO2_02_FULL_42_17]|uniref:UMP kinase n=1 Tax=Candidatus Nomurabacteria bacterium RIFCSPLOWO2_02_FULL_42_17 TaxID=1801789 RepID=A0A1F6XUB7_9BACT|nr:MAG: hypothetical protein A3I25_02735 [Candidatus Nomurabacteria bacterium RIFCSPLOWO2_02_FULL_42_17]
MTKTIVISLGGSLVVPDEIDVKFLLAFKKIIEQSVKKGFHFVITLGGGKVCRRYQEAARLVARPKPFDLDWIGIASLRLNAELMRVILRNFSHSKVINNPKDILGIKEKVVVCGAFGPGHSSDFDAVLFAEKVGAGTIINLSNIDYVYDKDPRKYKNAKPIKQISWIDFRKILPKKWNPGSNTPFDPVASVKAQKLGLKVVVMNGKKIKNLQNFILSRSFRGTVIS